MQRLGKTWLIGRRWEEKTCLIKIGLDKLVQFCTGSSSITPHYLQHGTLAL